MLNKNKQKQENQEILSVLFSTLEEMNVQYAVLRGYENLPYSYSNDIDFGIQKEHLDSFISVLKKVGGSFEMKLDIRDIRLDVLKLSLTNDRDQIDIDIWSSFNYAGLNYVDSSILKDIKHHNGIKIITPENELGVSFLKEMLHMNRIRKDKIKNLKEKLEGPIENVFSTYFSENNFRKFMEAIRQERYNIGDLSRRAKVNLIFSNFSKHGVSSTIMKVYTFFKVKRNRSFYMNKLEKEINAI